MQFSAPNQYPCEIDLLARYEEKMLHIFEGKIRRDIRRNIALIFNEIQPILVANAMNRGRYLPQQEDLVLLNIEALIGHIRSLGQPVPVELFEIQERYKLLPDCDPTLFRQRRKEVEALIHEHHIDMDLLLASKSRFDAKRIQIEARARNILARLEELISTVRPRISLVSQLNRASEHIEKDLNLISKRKLQQGHPSFLDGPSPLTTAGPSFRGSGNLGGTVSAFNITGVSQVTGSSDP